MVKVSFAWLGLLLQLLRERRGMTIAELGALLEVRGSGVSAATYGEMEAGRYLPDDGRQFLRMFASVLQLTDHELHVLVNLWALAVLTQELGEDLARESLGKKLITVRQTAS